MTSDALKNLARDVEAIHHGMKCRFAKKVFLPYRVYTPEVWTIEQTGPHPLDDVFFGLLKNRVNTREKIAKQLGVGQNEFVFTHLDVLIQKRYVVENENGYILTEQGRNFDSGNFKEERLKKIKFSFIWNDMTARIEPDIKFARSQTRNLQSVRGDNAAQLPLSFGHNRSDDAPPAMERDAGTPAPSVRPLLDALRKIEPDGMTPKEALEALYQLKRTSLV